MSMDGATPIDGMQMQLQTLDDLLLFKKVEGLMYAYANALDTDRLEDWPTFFTDTPIYKVLPKENDARGLPVGILSATSMGMLKDRVKSLREANIYNIHYPRHVVTNVELTGMDGNRISARANLEVYQSDQDGRTSLFCVGQYRDVIEHDPETGTLKFAERLVVIDTFNVPNLLAIPL